MEHHVCVVSAKKDGGGSLQLLVITNNWFGIADVKDVSSKAMPRGHLLEGAAECVPHKLGHA